MAFKIGEKMDDPIAMYLADIYTVLANLTGVPAISVPLHRHSNGMPYGLQIMHERSLTKKELITDSKQHIAIISKYII